MQLLLVRVWPARSALPPPLQATTSVHLKLPLCEVVGRDIECPYFWPYPVQGNGLRRLNTPPVAGDQEPRLSARFIQRLVLKHP